MKTRNIKDANEDILTLISSVKADVLSYDEAHLVGATIGNVAQMYSGFYECRENLIYINPSPPNELHDINETLLHELIHWTGHSKRLGRPAIKRAEKFNPLSKACIDEFMNNQNETATEEAIAQIGMYKLAVFLGLDEETYRAKKDVYIEKYPQADLEVAEQEASIAFNYIINPEIAKVAA